MKYMRLWYTLKKNPVFYLLWQNHLIFQIMLNYLKKKILKREKPRKKKQLFLSPLQAQKSQQIKSVQS